MAACDVEERQQRWNRFYEDEIRGRAPPWDPGEPCSQLVSLVDAGAVPLPRVACEIGCGAARCSEFLAHRGAERVDAVDISPIAVQTARKRLADLPAVAVHCVDLFSLLVDDRISSPVSEPYGRPAVADEAYDLVFDCQCFHVLRDVDEDRLARTMARLLRPGGVLVMLAGNAGEEARTPGPPVLTRKEATAALLRAGLDLVSLEETRFDPTPAYGATPPLAWLAVFRKGASH